MSGTDDTAAGSAQQAPEQRPGRLLAEARAQKNLSVAEVAQQLKLSAGQVEALEADAYERLPGPVFVRGFVRNYARLLDLDADALVAGLGMPHDSTPASATVPHSHNIPFPEQRPVKWRGYMAGLLVVLIAVALFEFFYSAPQAVVVVTPPPAPLPPSVPVPEPAAEVQLPAPPAAEPEKPDVAAAAPVAEVKPAPQRKDVADLHFVFSEQSWVEVRDGNDRLLFSQLNPAGAEQHVQGRPPLNVVVGNAGGVTLNYNGRPFDLAPHTRVAVARFRLE